jgi:hypothetical protein
VVTLRDLGARARVHAEDGDDLGICDLPRPVALGDLAALEEGTFRVVDVVDGLPPGRAIDVLAVVEPVKLSVVAQ